MLQLNRVNTYYGKSRILYDVSLRVGKGEIVALLGRNGAGKTTTIRSVMGLLKPASGEIMLENSNITWLPAFKRARMGVGYVPQGKHLFPRLTVLENLKFGLTVLRGSSTGTVDLERLEEVYKLFPYLKDKSKRVAGTLSGGEQQMVAIARALVTHPKLLLMDEPSEGLMPVLIERLIETIRSINKTGVTVFLAEQNLGVATTLADTVYILDNGTIKYEGGPQELLADDQKLLGFLGVKLRS